MLSMRIAPPVIIVELMRKPRNAMRILFFGRILYNKILRKN